MRRILLLAGTGEARAIAAALSGDPDFEVIASLAGATGRPGDLGVETRTGGFGGAAGLADFVRARGIDRIVDATHPFAAQMKRHAAAQTVPVLHVIRSAWAPVGGDQWIGCASLAEAAAALPSDAQAFLALGQRHLTPFRAHPATMWVRSVDAPVNRGPFRWITGSPGDLAHETELLKRHAITHLVCRNSGGSAGYAKLEAARCPGLPVLMIGRPEPPKGKIVAAAEEAVAWCSSRPEA